MTLVDVGRVALLLVGFVVAMPLAVVLGIAAAEFWIRALRLLGLEKRVIDWLVGE